MHWAIPKPPLALHFRDGTPNERLNLRMTNSHTFHIMLMVKGKSLYDGSKQALKLAPILKMGQKGNWAERGGDPQHCISSGESLLSFFTQSKLRLAGIRIQNSFFSAWWVAQFDGVLRFSCGGVHVHQSFKTFTPFLGRCPNININYNSYTKGPKGVFLRSISKQKPSK